MTPLEDRIEMLEKNMDSCYELIYRVLTDPTIRSIIRENEETEILIKKLENQVEKLETTKRESLEKRLKHNNEMHKAFILPLANGEHKIVKMGD